MSLPGRAAELPELEQRPIRLHRILNRGRKESTVSPQDFFLEFSREIGPGDLSNGIFYCIDFQDKSVLYTLLDDVANALEAPFLYEAQIALASGVARVPFERLSDVLTGSLCPPALIFSIGRCGSTLLTRMMYGIGLPAVSEPQSLVQLARTPAEERDKSRQSVSLLIRSCLDSMTRHYAGRTIVKLASQCSLVAADILQAMPEAHVVFMLRERKSWARSTYRAFGWEPRHLAYWLCAYIKACDWLLLNHPNARLMWYEDLIEDPERELRQAGLIGEDFTEDQRAALRATMTKDSQQGTGLSREKLASRVFSDEAQRAFDEEWARLKPFRIIEQRGLWKLL
jgi:hypothetical protein